MNITEENKESKVEFKEKKKYKSSSLGNKKTYYPTGKTKKNVEHYSEFIGSSSELVCELLDKYFKENPNQCAPKASQI